MNLFIVENMGLNYLKYVFLLFQKIAQGNNEETTYKKRKGGIKICSNEETTDNIHKTTQELKKEDETNY